VREARRCNQQILRPDVNVSGASWSMDVERQAIRRGLNSIDKVGSKAAVTIEEERVANGPFADVADMVERLPGRPVSGGKQWAKDGTLNGVMQKLREAGALTSVGLKKEDA